MADPRMAYSHQEIEETWRDPEFNTLSEDQRIAIVSEMDPRFAGFPGIDRRRIAGNMYKQFGKPAAPPPQRPPTEAAADLALAQSGLPPAAAPDMGQIRVNPQTVSEYPGAIADTIAAPFRRGPIQRKPQAQQTAMPEFDITTNETNAGDLLPRPLSLPAKPPEPSLPATKPAGIPRNVARQGPYTTILQPIEEQEFRKWVAQNNLPFDPGPQSDYDMRGLWRAQRQRDQRAVIKSGAEGKPELPESWKTPFHPTFSADSIYAGPDAPKWVGGKLVDSFGRVLKDKDYEKAAGKAFDKQQQNAERLANKSIADLMKGKAVPTPNGPPVPNPALAGIVPGMQQLGSEAPGVPEPQQAQQLPPVPSWQELQAKPNVPEPQTFFDPMSGTNEPWNITDPAQAAQYGMNDPGRVLARQAVSGAAGLALDAPGGLASMAGNAVDSDALRATGDTLSAAGRMISEPMAPPPDMPNYERDGSKVFSDPRWWAASVGNGIGSMVPMIMTGAASGAVIEKALTSGMIRGPLADVLVKYGPSAAAGLQEGILAGGNAYNEAKASGASEDQARAAFGTVAATTAATSIPAFAAGAFNEALPLAARIPAGMAAEGLQEVAQGRGEDLAKQIYNPGATMGSQDAENFVGGAFGGAVAAPMEMHGSPRQDVQRGPTAQPPSVAPLPLQEEQQTPPVEAQTPPVETQQPKAARNPFKRKEPVPAQATTPAAEQPAPQPTPPTPAPAPPAAPVEDIPADIDAMMADAEEREREPHVDSYDAAVEVARRRGRITPTLLQNDLVIDGPQAEALAARLEKDGIVGPAENGVRWLRDPEEAEPIASEAKNDAKPDAKEGTRTTPPPGPANSPTQATAEVADNISPQSKSEPEAEEKKPDREFSSTQVNLPETEARAVRELAARIPDEALTEDGREDDVHATVKFGLHGNDPEAVRRALADEGPVRVKLGKVSLFENDDADVVKIDVDSPDLHRLNKKIADAIPHTDTHPDYKPHVTIAYVKPGEGKKFLGLNDLEGREITLNSLTFSGKDRSRVEIPLGGRAETPAQNQPVADDTSHFPTSNEVGLQVKNAEQSEPFKGARALVDRLHQHVRDGIAIADTPALNRIVAEATGTSVGAGIDQKQAYDAVETAVNSVLAEKPEYMTTPLVKERIGSLKTLLDRLPTQTTRTDGQVAAQQFSTPPPLAYIAARAAGIQRGDVVLEPSAGTGGLAGFAKAAGADVVTNEIDESRRGFLGMQGYRTFGENAEQLHNILPTDVQPDVVLMNPPFSSSVVRGGANSNTIGYSHVIQAMKRLKPGGRLVAILGGGAKMGNPNAANFWKQMREAGVVRADIGINGEEYRKYGTTFDNRLIVIDKGAKLEDGQAPIRGEYNSIEEAWDAIASIAGRDRRAGGSEPDPGSVRAPSPANSDGRRGGPGVPRQPSGSRTSGSGAVGADESGGPAGSSRGDIRAESEPTPQQSEGSVQRGSERGTSDTSPEPDRRLGPQKPAQLEDEGDFTVYDASSIPANWQAEPHKAKIVETQSMAGVQAPKVTTKPNIDWDLVRRGELSDVQLTSIGRAAQAFASFLPNGERIGYFIGDGTGVGKGRQIGGTILHLWNSGVRRIVWVSYNETLINDAKRDLNDLKANIPVVWLGDVNVSKPIADKMKDGVVFAGYSTLASMSNEDKKKTDKGFVPFRRVRQILDWAGENPAIIFDEAHKAKNAGGSNSERGKSKGTNSGRAVLSLQTERPKAYVLYSSATGFTEPDNLVYAQRLGLWGEGTAFKDFNAFKNTIEKGGIGAMEMVARDLKAQGRYESRFISYGKDKNGVPVEFDEVEHTLTKEQRAILDEAAGAWRTVRERMWEAFKTTEAPNRKRAQVASQFYGAMQRFYMTVLTSMKMPTLTRIVDEALDANQQVIVSVLLTGEAAQERALQEREEEGLSLDDLDMSPAKMLQQLVDKAFPTQQYETFTDADGNESSRPVFDREGNPVQNAEAVAEKQALLERLSALRMPDSAIDQLVNRYGGAKVAELTGRDRRIEIDPKSGQRIIVERKGGDRVKIEADQFQNGDKRIAIISPASSTGISLHASNKAKNKGRRRHVILQLMWSADQQMQVFGRSHRTDQAIPPHYTLLTMNVGGEKRFASSIARRLEQLGALSRGDRGSSGAGSIANYNFESGYGHSAVNQVMKQMVEDEGYLGGRETVRMMGLERLIPQDEDQQRKKDSVEIEVKTFLNRVSVLPVSLQNRVFDAFMDAFQRNIELAKAEGRFDQGAEKIKAHEIVQTADPIVVRTDEATGAQTFWYQLDARHKRPAFDWSWVEKNVAVGYKLIRNERSGGLALVSPKVRTSTDETTGAIVNRHSISRPNGESITLSDQEMKTWQPVEAKDAKDEWEEQREAAGTYRVEKVNLIGGSVLPIYGSFIEGNSVPQVKIADLKDGSRVLGVQVAAGRIRQVLRNIGYGLKADGGEIFERLAANDNSYTLSNGIKLSRTQLQGDNVIQLVDVPPEQDGRLLSMGVQKVMISFRPRYFIPLRGDTGRPTLAKVLKAYPPVADRGGSLEYEADGESDRRRGPLRSSSEAGFVAPDILSVIAKGLVEKLRGNPTQKQPANHFEWSDPAVEKRFQNAGRAQDEPNGIMDKLREANEALKGMFRVYEYLPREKFGRLIFEMKKLEKARGIASSRALVDMVHVLGKMSQPDFELLRKAVIADDLMETLELFEEQGETVPESLAFGFTPDTLRTEHTRVQQAAADNPLVKQALAHRRQVWDRVKSEYLEAMDEAGEDVSGKLKRKNYYRHRVLLQKRLERLAQQDSKLQVPAGRGFLKRRQADAMSRDYATNFIETEMQVMTQLMLDTRTARFVAYLDRELNIRKRLENEAKWQNVQTVMPHFQRMADQENAQQPADSKAPHLTAEDMFRRTLNRDQAIAMDAIGKLATQGQLPDTDDGRWAGTIADIAASYLERKAARREGEESGGIDADVLGYAAWVMRQKQPSEASAPAAQLFKGIRRKQQTIKQLAGEDFVTWEDIIPESHSRMQVDPTRAYYSVFAVPEQLAMQVMEDNAEQVGLKKEDLRKVFAVGAEAKPMVLPAEVVKQFDQMAKEIAERRAKTNVIYRGAQAVMGHYKRYLLLAPQRAVKYLLRNQTGDMDSMMAGLPWIQTAKQWRQVAGSHQKEVAQYFLPLLKGDIGNAALSPELQKFADFGAFEGLLAVQEIGDPVVPDVIRELSAWEKKEDPPTFLQRRGPAAAYRGWMRQAEIINNWREAANRYAAYRVFLDEIRRNGKPSSYSASLPAEVDALPTPEEKAYRMSNDLMGAYDEVSVAGRTIRKWFIPFWSYQELNFRRYARLMRNGINEGRAAKTAGRMAIGAAARAPYMAYRAGSTMLKMYALWALATAFNGLFDDDDEKLRREVRERPHVTLGSSPDGNEVVYFPRIGNINDILEWLDLDEFQDQVKAAWEGRKPWHSAALDSLRGGPAEKLFLSAGHHIKYPLEYLFGKTYYPNVDRPRAIESWPEKVAQDFGFGDAFRTLTSRPVRQASPLQRAADLAIYRSDPGESAYYDILELKRSWLREQGIPDNGFTSNKPSTEALRNVKKSLRYGDQAAFNHYLQKYVELGGTEKGLESSIKAMAPLQGLKREQQQEFIEQLSPDDKRRLDQALDYYQQTFNGDTAKTFFSEFTPK